MSFKIAVMVEIRVLNDLLINHQSYKIIMQKIGGKNLKGFGEKLELIATKMK